MRSRVSFTRWGGRADARWKELKRSAALLPFALQFIKLSDTYYYYLWGDDRWWIQGFWDSGRVIIFFVDVYHKNQVNIKYIYIMFIITFIFYYIFCMAVNYTTTQCLRWMSHSPGIVNRTPRSIRSIHCRHFIFNSMMLVQTSYMSADLTFYLVSLKLNTQVLVINLLNWKRVIDPCASTVTVFFSY